MYNNVYQHVTLASPELEFFLAYLFIYFLGHVLWQVLGTDELNAYLNKYHIELDPHLAALVGRLVILSYFFQFVIYYYYYYFCLKTCNFLLRNFLVQAQPETMVKVH